MESKNSGEGPADNDRKKFTTNDSKEYRFGYFGWKPDCLQRINRPVWLLVFLSFYALVQVCLITSL